MEREDLELLAIGLLSGKPTLGQNLSQGLLMMNQGRNDRKDRLTRQQQQDMALQMQKMQLEQAQQQQADRARIEGVYAQNFQPAQAQQTAPFQADQFPGEAPLQGNSTITQQARPAGYDMKGLQAGLMAMGPQGFQQAAQVAQMTQKQQPKFADINPKDFTPESVRQFQQTGRYGDLMPKPEKQPDWQNPEYQAFMLKKAREGAPKVDASVRQEGAFSKKMGENYAEEYTNLMKGDAAATSKITRFGRLGELLSKAGTTGRFTPATKELASAAQSLGIKVDASKLGSQEAVEALSNEIALSLRNPAGGAGMPGALSDKDREFLVNMVPGLGKTPQGNQLMIQTAVKLAEREREVARLAREYKKQNGRFDEGFYQVLAEYSAQNPLFEQQAAPQAEQGGFSIRRIP